MSTTIDQKVVEMRFDNRNFEKNVATTMSTLDRFKQKLKFSESSKGLEELERASRKLTFNPMSKGIEEVTARFKVMDIAAFTAINRITNSVIDFSKKTAKTLLGINSLKDGFDEYSLTMNTIQTLINSTGDSMEYIKKQLQEIVYSYVNVYDVVRDIHWWLENYIGDFFADELEVEDITSFYTFIENELYQVIFRCIDDNYYVKYGDVIKIVFYMLIDRYGVISNKGMENCPHLDEDHRLEKYKELLDKGITISKLFEIIDTYVKKIGGCEYHKDTHTDT